MIKQLLWPEVNSIKLAHRASLYGVAATILFALLYLSEILELAAPDNVVFIFSVMFFVGLIAGWCNTSYFAIVVAPLLFLGGTVLSLNEGFNPFDVIWALLGFGYLHGVRGAVSWNVLTPLAEGQLDFRRKLFVFVAIAICFLGMVILFNHMEQSGIFTGR